MAFGLELPIRFPELVSGPSVDAIGEWIRGRRRAPRVRDGLPKMDGARDAKLRWRGSRSFHSVANLAAPEGTRIGGVEEHRVWLTRVGRCLSGSLCGWSAFGQRKHVGAE